MAIQKNFDIVISEALDNLLTLTREKMGEEKLTNQDGAIPFGISRDWSKAQPSLREIGMGDELVDDILKRIDNASLGELRQAKNGDWVFEGITWGTVAPDFSSADSESCCFTEKFTMTATGDATPM